MEFMKIYVFLPVFIAPQLCAEIIFSDDFESGDTSHTQNGFRWTDSANTKVSNLRAKTGVYALEFRFAPAGGQNEDAWSERRFELGAAYEDLWIKYDLYIPANYYHRIPADQVTNNKGLIMLWSDEYFTNQHMSLHFFPSEANPGGSVIYGNYSVNTEEEGMRESEQISANACADNIVINRGTDLDKWVEFVIHTRASKNVNPGDGVIQVWKNGCMIYNLSNISNYHPTGNGLERGYLLGWANSGFDDIPIMYIDDIKFAETLADLEVTLTAPKPPEVSVQ